MNKKYIAFILLGMVLLGTIATLSISMVAAQDDDDVIVGQNEYQTHHGQGEKTYRFRQRTRVRINASHNVHLNMSVDALEIGDRTFSIDMECDGDVEMNMWAVRDQDRLGLQNGSTIRHQHRHQIRNNFMAKIQVNETVRTRIGMEMTRGDATRASWAYYDEPTNEWVEVESSYEDGMLVTDTELTTTASIWTITEGASLTGLWIGIGVGVVALGALGAILIRKKRI